MSLLPSCRPCRHVAIDVGWPLFPVEATNPSWSSALMAFLPRREKEKKQAHNRGTPCPTKPSHHTFVVGPLPCDGRAKVGHWLQAESYRSDKMIR